ncbi:MAG: hypothetical protein AMS19_02570 [Gemmatimonas sp. SG8_23]|jgi:zinc D-Ala-D-Ala carboxypeptidase|nr:MAG: hypothetical protein AMS19_02570 [Gemmatimonas sp. SG8_23]
MGDISEHLSTWEVACRCQCGLGSDPDDIASSIVSRFELIRYIVDRAVYINSGLRCPAWNEAQGGVESSAHTRGTALDLAVGGGIARIQFIVADLLARLVELEVIKKREARELFRRILEGIGGLGVANGFIHIDTDEEKPRPSAWTY